MMNEKVQSSVYIGQLILGHQKHLVWYIPEKKFIYRIVIDAVTQKRLYSQSFNTRWEKIFEGMFFQNDPKPYISEFCDIKTLLLVSNENASGQRAKLINTVIEYEKDERSFNSSLLGATFGLRVVGDPHGYLDEKSPQGKSFFQYKVPTQHLISLGDNGFDLSALDKRPYDDHKEVHLLAGNHDHYGLVKQYENYFLGDFGIKHIAFGCSPYKMSFYFVRGAESIDYTHRTEGVDLFKQDEELSVAQGYALMDDFGPNKPNILISHDAPISAIKALHQASSKKGFVRRNDHGVLSNQASATQQMLESVLQQISHEVDWFVGHHHQTKTFRLGTVTFHFLGELDFMDLPVGYKAFRKKGYM